jgi:hypothetical protein
MHACCEYLPAQPSGGGELQASTYYCTPTSTALGMEVLFQSRSNPWCTRAAMHAVRTYLSAPLGCVAAGLNRLLMSNLSTAIG